jgi:ATP adenylyltransferase
VTRSGEASACVFCESQTREEAGALIVAERETCFVILNLYPYNNGHVMVVPRRHVATLAALEPGELADLASLTRLTEIALTKAYTPEGINVGINIGRPAGAGIVDHLHIHLVPRWAGDTSFMSVVGQVRVLPEELPQTAVRLRAIFAEL